MNRILRFAAKRSLLAALALVAAAFLFSPAAHAGVAIENTVVLDPFDPVPPIQFQHWYAGYGCDNGCGRNYGCYDRCERRPRCYSDCERPRCRDNCRSDCGDRCERRTRCDRDCGRDNNCCDDNRASNCVSARCYDVERWEHRWRDGDHSGQDWYTRGHRERVRSDDKWDGDEKNDSSWNDDDGPPPEEKH